VPGQTKVIDIHVHLAGLGEGGTGCHISPRMRRSVQFRALRSLAALAGIRTDSDYADQVVRHVETSTALDYACLFAMDGVYDAQGEWRPDLSHLYVPNDYVIAVAERSPKLLPVISINPQRKDALEELEKYGPRAVAMKWLPPAQLFDPSLPQYEDFRQLVARLRLPIICHSGTEHTLPRVQQHLGNPALCEPLLKRDVPVVFAHCSTCTLFQPGVDHVPEFHRLLATYPHAFGDTAGFCSVVRYRNVFRFSAQRYLGRVLHGSDFPVPTTSLYFWRKLGLSGVKRLEAIRNPLDRDAETKRAAGMPPEVFTSAYALLEDRIRNIKGTDAPVT
jgi:predicted TIM-barrel fold metal-dependent hydrolase